MNPTLNVKLGHRRVKHEAIGSFYSLLPLRIPHRRRRLRIKQTTVMIMTRYYTNVVVALRNDTGGPPIDIHVARVNILTNPKLSQRFEIRFLPTSVVLCQSTHVPIPRSHHTIHSILLLQ
jgi:hypothetical protein